MTGEAFGWIALGVIFASIAFGTLGLYLYARRHEWSSGTPNPNTDDWNDPSDVPAGNDSQTSRGKPPW